MCVCVYRVHIHGQLEGLSDEAPLGGQKKTTAVVAMIMKEVPAFTQMEADPGVTMKIRGVTMEMALISLLNAEPFHLQGG